VSKEIYKTSRKKARGFANDYYRELLTSFFFRKKTKRNIDINQHYTKFGLQITGILPSPLLFFLQKIGVILKENKHTSSKGEESGKK
jgi:hypothetical protein